MTRPGGGGAERAWMLAAAGLYLALTTWVVSSRHYWPRYDSGAYISAATAMARGIGLRDITAPVTRPADSWAQVPAWVRRSPERMARADWPVFVLYPPLLPLALSLFVAIGGGRFLVLQMVPLIAGLGTLALAYRWRDTLFRGPWRLTLLVTAGSMLALYGTRVQSEAVHPLLALAALRVLARAGEDAARLGRWALIAALVLLLGIAVHVKLVFFAAGAAVWLVVGPHAPLGRRLRVAAAFAALTIVPPLVFTFSASWAGRAGLPGSSAAFTLLSNPYYGTDGRSTSAPTLAEAGDTRVRAARARSTGPFLWNGITVGPQVPRVDPNVPAAVPVVLLAAAGLLAAPWWRHRRGLLALPTVAYVAAVVLSPWTESRMAVPVLPLVAHALATAFGRIPSLLGAHGARPARQALVAAGLGVMTLQALHWRALTPEWDEYSLEYWKRWETLAMARAAGGVPLERAILAHTDSAAFALVTGRATQDLSPAEWKMSDPRVFLANGGAPVVLGPLMRSELLPGASALDGELAALAGPRTREAVSLGEYGLVLEWVGPPPATAGAVGPDPVVPGRIHPRWMRLTPADREPLARAAIPDARR